MSGGARKRLPETAPAQNAGEAIAGGTLVLVVGPSGAGKDTLLDAARGHFRSHPSILFLQRIITRADQTGEAHAVLSESEFARREAEGGFFLAWEAHGLKYGVSADCRDALIAGKTVVVNVSRQIIPAACGLWARTRVIYVNAPKEIRQQRLVARGREPAGSIYERLERAQVFAPPDGDWVSHLDNSGSLADGIAAFNALIAGLLIELADSGAGSGTDGQRPDRRPGRYPRSRNHPR